MKKTFTLGTVLTVTTGRLLTKAKSETDNGIDDLYELLGHMVGESPYTHTLGRFAEECKPYLLETFPELHKADTDVLDEMLKYNFSVDSWLEICSEGMSETYDIEPIPKGVHVSKNPYH